MRAGMTLIELIFIIIILGILAALAIPKLAATRDDAKLSTDVSNMALCIRDAASTYTASQVDFTAADHSPACDVACYSIIYAVNGEDFNVTTDPTAENFCAEIDFVGGHLAKSYDFGGSQIVR